MKTLINKSLISALAALFIIAFSPIASAAENPFGMGNTVDMNVVGGSMNSTYIGDDSEGV